ncbi:hypothetical protein CR513_39841, partial [Mucuna pruriens]
MSILQVGGGYPRPLPNGTRVDYILDSSSRLLHQMGGSGTDRQHFNRKDQMILLEEDHLPFRLTGRDCIRQRNAVCIPLHGRANGQVEAANKVILRGLQKRLEEAKGRWVEELPQLLWLYHTTPHYTTNETPFRLMFGTKAMISIEIGELSP